MTDAYNRFCQDDAKHERAEQLEDEYMSPLEQQRRQIKEFNQRLAKLERDKPAGRYDSDLLDSGNIQQVRKERDRLLQWKLQAIEREQHIENALESICYALGDPTHDVHTLRAEITHHAGMALMQMGEREGDEIHD